MTLYALAADLAAAEGSIVANASVLVAVNTSLTLDLASKANQSALDALHVEVNGKSTPASVDLKLANHPTTAAMNSSITSANNATLASLCFEERRGDRRGGPANSRRRGPATALGYVAQAAFNAALAL